MLRPTVNPDSLTVVFGISGLEFIVLVVLTFFVIGRDRRPESARPAQAVIKTVRRMAFDAKDDFKDALGDTGLDDINWRQYDPRQYDPRVIVREAFAEDDAERAREAKEREEKNKPVASNITRLPRGAYAPFDTEAT